jgi:caffeoyl-CoA O-methyltransferase
MSRKTLNLDPSTYRYMLDVSLREPDLMQRLRDETATLNCANMQISPEQGQFMALLVALMGARRVIELGVFTGYSALAVALALPSDGRMVACDVNADWTARGRRYWREAGIEEKIDLRLAPALQTLDDLLAKGQAGSYDFAFVDADKGNYIEYYERLMQLLRPGGLIAVDNVLWDGAVADPGNTDTDTEAIRAFNEHLRTDTRISLSLVPIGDGLTLALKRG